LRGRREKKKVHKQKIVQSPSTHAAPEEKGHDSISNNMTE